MERSKDDIITHYHQQGYAYSEIVNLLLRRHDISISLRQVKRILKRLGLKRRMCTNSSLEEICAAILDELDGSGSCLGYKSLWRRLQNTYGILVKRDTLLPADVTSAPILARPIHKCSNWKTVEQSYGIVDYCCRYERLHMLANYRLRVCRNLSTSLERYAMPPKRGRPAKAGSTKAVANLKVTPKTPAKKTKREEDDEDEEPESKKAKTEAKKPMMNKVDTKLDDMDFGCDKLNANGDKYNLKISTWNVSGIRAIIKKSGIEYIVKEDADIVALQETKCDSDKLPVEVKIPGYERYFLESKKPGYCGLALYSKVKPIEVKYGLPNSSCNDEGRCITAEYDKFYLINVYVPNAGQKLVTMPKRLKWNEAFKIHVQKLDKEKPVIVCGDMNVAHQEIDLTNPKTNTKNAGFTKEERDGMTDFLGAGFVDTFRDLYPEKTGAYTFWSYFNNARGKNIGWRLDYYLVSERIRKNICDNVIRDKVYGSDHCPVVLYANL